jgi:hypothetical protein
MTTNPRNNSVKHTDEKPSIPDILSNSEIKFKGLYCINAIELNRLHQIDKEVLLKETRLYLVIEMDYLGKKQLFATPFRTNIPKNHPPFKPLRKMAGSGVTKKGKTHGIHIAKTIPVKRRHLLKSRHANNYLPLIEDGTLYNHLPEIVQWIELFEGNEINKKYRPKIYSTQIKMLLES